MAVSAHLRAAIEADLGRGRQEELPLSHVDERGRSYNPRGQDESRFYNHRIKQELENNWSSMEAQKSSCKDDEGLNSLDSDAIVDAESEQMQGLTNLNARPWASMGPPQATRFEIPRVNPPVAPQQVSTPPLTQPASAPPSSQPAPQIQQPQIQVVYGGKCEVSMREGHTIVRDAAFSIQVAADRETAAFILTASGKPTVTLTVLDFEVPVISGMSCVIKTIPVAGAGATIYTVKPFEPATAEKLAKCLDSLQVVVRKRLGLPLAPTPQPPLTPQVKVAPPRSLICAHSPESSTEQSPRLRSRELVELSPRTPVQLDEVIGNIRVLVRNAYCQATGCSVPMLPAASPGEQQQQADAKLSAWLKKGKLDSDADETKLVLEKILCFLGDLQFSMAAAREPLMSSKTMEEMRTISPSAKSQRYSAPEILELNKVAVVPAGLESAAEIIEVKEEAAMLAGMDNASDAMKPEETAVVTLAAKPKMGLRSSLWAHK